MRWTRGLACVLLALLFPAIASAVDFRGDQHVVIPADEVIEGDVYLSGETVTVDGVVLGDLVAVGREVTLGGRVGGDFIAAGQAVVVRGTVGDDMRIAGMVLVLGAEATVADHIVSAGYSFETEPGSQVGGDVIFRGAKARLAGDVGARLEVSAGAVELAGEVIRDVEIEVADGMTGTPWLERFFPVEVAIPTVAGGLTVEESAHIGGRLTYASPEEDAAIEGVIAEGVAWKPLPTAPRAGVDVDEATPGLASRVGTHLRRFAALLLVGLLLLWLTPTWVDGWTETLTTKPLPSFGWGLVGHAGFPIAVLAMIALIILVAVLVGALSLSSLVALIVPLGLALLIAFVVAVVATAVLAAPVLVSTAGGHALFARAWPARASSRYLPFLAGLVLYVLMTALPFVGWGLELAAAVLGVGVIIQWLLVLRRPGRQVAATA